MMRSAALAGVLVLSAMTGQVRAQDGVAGQGNPGRGLALAQEVCGSCHAIRPEQPSSPEPHAPPFAKIAKVPGMTAAALTVVLRTSHRQMPNLLLSPEDQRNVIAYILTLSSAK